MLKKILSVSGKPGLYKLVSQGKSMLIVEALTDGRRLPVYAREKIISLGDIAIYTDGDEVPLYEVLNWYNLLISAGITDFDPQESAEEEDVEAPEATAKETHATPPPVVKNTAPKTSSAAAKTPVGKSTQRMRQK